jgi:GT2 family glycosyltransferase
MRTDVLRRTGPFDPIFGSYYEDYDLCRRVRALGYRVGFARAAAVHHFSGSATTDEAKRLRRERQILRNRTILEVREASGGRIPAVLRHVAGVPRRLARALMGTASAQRPASVIGAQRDLLGVAGRLLSAERDEAAWQAYLRQLGWADV